MVELGLQSDGRGSGADASAAQTGAQVEGRPLQLPPRSESLSCEVWASLGLTEAGATVVNRIRSGDPVRRPRPGAQNWAGAEYLDLMGFTVGVESRTLERAFYRLTPRQSDLLEVFDQPYLLRWSVKRPDGKQLPPSDHVPDALCIRTTRVHFTECKPWARLLAIQEKYPDKYCLGDDGRWRSPAAERALEGTGIGYEIYTDRDINPVLLRNANFLRDYEREPAPTPDLVAPVLSALAKDPIQTLEDLFAVVADRRAVYLAIAHGLVFFDVGRDLANEDRSPIYRDETAWKADQILRAKLPHETVQAPAFCPEPGAKVTFKGRDAEIVSADANGIWLRTDEGHCPYLETDEIVTLMIAKSLVWPRTNTPLGTLARARLARAKTEDVQSAIAVYRTIEPWISGKRRGGTSRTDRRKIRLFRTAEAVFGHGLAGLLDRTRLRGNRTSRLSEQQEKTVDAFIQSDYLDAARSIDATLALINPALKSMGEERVSRRAVKRRIDKVPPEEREKRRHGTRMGNAARSPHVQTDQPAKGERAFEVGMIDSFSVPMKVYSRRTGQIITTPLWGTLLWNVYPPYPLGLALQFERPSTRSVMAACRDCVRRYNRLPDNNYYDLGSEHGSLTLDLMEVEYGTNFLKRPAGNARFGTDIEVHIGVFKAMVREYRGSYKRIPRRGGTASHSPEHTSKWYWEDFDADFRELVFVDWPDMEHEGIAVRPAVLWRKSIEEQGARPTRFIPYDDNFIVLTMPIVKGAATVNPTRGVRYDYVWYHAPELDNPRWHKDPVTLREPVDESHIIVQLGADWVRCEPVSYVFRLFSHREQRLLLEEWRAEARQTNSKERLTPEAFERLVTRIAEKEGRFDRAQAAAAGAAQTEAGAPPANAAPTQQEEVDEFTFTADPVL
jgi:hypothetical protein